MALSVFTNHVASASDMVQLINSKTAQTSVTAELKAGNQITLRAEEGRRIFLSGTQVTSTWSNGQITLVSKDTVTIYDVDADMTGLLGFAKNATLTFQPDSVGLTVVDLKTRAGAQDALLRFEFALDRALEDRGKLGAIQNRLEATRVIRFNRLSTERVEKPRSALFAESTSRSLLGTDVLRPHKKRSPSLLCPRAPFSRSDARNFRDHSANRN